MLPLIQLICPELTTFIARNILGSVPTIVIVVPVLVAIPGALPTFSVRLSSSPPDHRNVLLSPTMFKVVPMPSPLIMPVVGPVSKTSDL